MVKREGADPTPGVREMVIVAAPRPMVREPVMARSCRSCRTHPASSAATKASSRTPASLVTKNARERYAPLPVMRPLVASCSDRSAGPELPSGVQEAIGSFRRSCSCRLGPEFRLVTLIVAPSATEIQPTTIRTRIDLDFMYLPAPFSGLSIHLRKFVSKPQGDLRVQTPSRIGRPSDIQPREQKGYGIGKPPGHAHNPRSIRRV
jgi:hypothetical protein